MEKQFQTQISENRIHLQNQAIRLWLDRDTGGTWVLAGLSRREEGSRNWITSSKGMAAPLWKLRFLREKISEPTENNPSWWQCDMHVQQETLEMDSRTPAEISVDFQKDEAGGKLSLRWLGCTHSEAEGHFDVTIQIRLEPESALSQWSIDIQNHTRNLSLLEVAFPDLGNLEGGQETTLIVPDGWGRAIPNPGSHQAIYDYYYPCGRAAMNCFFLSDGKQTLYLSPRDPDGYIKHFHLTGNPAANTFAYSLWHPTETGGQMRNSFVSPYTVDIGVLDGDWWAAAKTYRQWARTTPWMRKGKMADRTDVPDWIKKVAIWARPGTPKEEDIPGVTRDTLAFARYFNVPTAAHWYNWHQIPFDNRYPEYFPVKNGFKEAVALLQKEGIAVVPYINGRLWDIKTDSWFEEKAEEAVTKTLDGRKYVDSYGTQVRLAVMCPTTPLWQNKVSDIVERMADELGVAGVYIDQVSSAPPPRCYDRTHGHTPGGGSYWVNAYEKLVSQAHDAGQKHRQDFILTTEDPAEPFDAVFDALLMCNSQTADCVPLYAAIYSGATLTFGRYLSEADLQDPRVFRAKMSKIFLWGAQLAWMDPDFILKPQYAGDAALLKQMAEVKVQHYDYLTFGEIVAPPQVDSSIPVFRTAWCENQPAVELSAWKHVREDRWAIFLVNITSMAVDVAWTFPVENANQRRVMVQGSDPVPAQVKGNAISSVIQMPPLSVRVIEIA